MKPQASLRSAGPKAVRRNPQNTVTQFPDYRLKMISKVPRKTFPSPTLFLFFSLHETVKYSKYLYTPCNFCMNYVKVLQKYDHKYVDDKIYISTNCNLFYHSLIVTRRLASLPSPQVKNTLPLISSLIPLKILSQLLNTIKRIFT